MRQLALRRDDDLQDIFTLFHLDRPFKFVSKTSNFFIPIVGWSMFLTGDYQAVHCPLCVRLAL